MNSDRNPRIGQVPLPGFAEASQAKRWLPTSEYDEASPSGESAHARAQGLRHVRRMSNWTAAALLVGTGAATVALAHNALPVAAPVASSSTTTPASGTSAVTTSTNGTHGPQVAHTVATTSASGVTTTTTTHVVNGKTVVTHARSLAPGATIRD